MSIVKHSIVPWLDGYNALLRTDTDDTPTFDGCQIVCIYYSTVHFAVAWYFAMILHWKGRIQRVFSIFVIIVVSSCPAPVFLRVASRNEEVNNKNGTQKRFHIWRKASHDQIVFNSFLIQNWVGPVFIFAYFHLVKQMGKIQPLRCFRRMAIFDRNRRQS